MRSGSTNGPLLTRGSTPTGRRTPLAIVVVMAVLAASCASGDTAKPGGPTTTVEQPAKGGTLVMALFGEPACADWLATCGTSAAGFLGMARFTAPRPLDLIDGQYRPTAILTGQPTVDPGTPQRVTYRINPKAVWSDGQPFTSSDFRFTWDQVVTGASVANRAGFDQIDRVDDSDPKTAVVTFKTPYAAWRTLFATILPQHILDGKDRSAEMKDGYSWSAGPWIIDHWTRGSEIKLVPNPNYWDQKPNLDAVVWKIIADPSAALAAYKSGQVALVIGAVPPEVTIGDLRSLPDTKADVATSFGISFIDFNTQKAPLDSQAVRQALAYSTDRDALVAQTQGPLKPDVKPVQAWMTPAYGKWYTESYAKYRRDLATVDQLMRGDGWAKGGDGIWAKGDQKAQFELLGTSGGNQLVEQVLQSQWKAAGFDVTVSSLTAPARADREAKANYQAGLQGFLFSNTGDDPGRCAFFCSRNIPSSANGNSGMNTTRISSPALDEAWDRVNTEVDEVKRLDAVRRANDLTADLMPGLPYAPQLAALVYNSAKIGGPVTNNVPTPFYNLNEWYCRGGHC